MARMLFHCSHYPNAPYVNTANCYWTVFTHGAQVGNNYLFGIITVDSGVSIIIA